MGKVSGGGLGVVLCVTENRERESDEGEKKETPERDVRQGE